MCLHISISNTEALFHIICVAIAITEYMRWVRLTWKMRLLDVGTGCVRFYTLDFFFFGNFYEPHEHYIALWNTDNSNMLTYVRDGMAVLLYALSLIVTCKQFSHWLKWMEFI